MYQTDGWLMARCGSLASSAPPLVWLGPTIQLFDPSVLASSFTSG